MIQVAQTLLAQAADISRTKAVEWIQRGLVQINDATAVKSTKVPGDILTISIPDDPDPLEVKPELVQDLIVVDDEAHYVVIDKPVG